MAEYNMWTNSQWLGYIHITIDNEPMFYSPWLNLVKPDLPHTP